MYPTQHAAAAALTLLPLKQRGWQWPCMAAFAAGAVLIDVDHYLSYVWEHGDFSLIRAYQFHRGHAKQKEREFAPHLVNPKWFVSPRRPFHPVVLIAAFWLLTRKHSVLHALAWGLVLHRLQDYLWESMWKPAEAYQEQKPANRRTPAPAQEAAVIAA